MPRSITDHKFFFFNTEYNTKYFPQKKRMSMEFVWKFVFLTDSYTPFYCFSTVNNIFFQQHFWQEMTRKQSVSPKKFIVIYLLFFQPTGLLHRGPQKKFWKKNHCVKLTSTPTCQKHIQKNIFSDSVSGKEKPKKKFITSHLEIFH